MATDERPFGAESLHRAAMTGDSERLAMLLDRGAAVDAVDADGRTALIVAALQGRTEAVRVLLAHGAAVNARDRDGRSALSVARARHEEAMSLLLERAGGRE